ncbi:hypothetical protein ACFVV7_35550 [Streptomyces globisporus]|uniref:hypothetical protein n=1 Tax=Streptomyces globisporus TaxID=1908 RepID=UPI0036D92AC7
MHDSPVSPGAGHRWLLIKPLTQQTAEDVARTVQFTRHALRAYMVRHITSEVTAANEIRQLLERFLQVGRLSRAADGTVRARSPKADGDWPPYSILLDLETRHVIAYTGPDVSWFDDIRLPLEELRQHLHEQRQREQEEQLRRTAHEQRLRVRRTAHEQRMRQEQEAAAARRAGAAEPAWPVLPDGYYDQEGKPTPAPARRWPIADEARIRRLGRLQHVVFHSDALNSPFFRQTPVEVRHEALQRVLHLLLRAPSKGSVTIGAHAITVTGKKVTMTLSPDCAAVRTLNPPRPGNKNPTYYQARKWTKERKR